MADTKVSGLPAVAAFATTLEFPVNSSGASKKISGAQLIAALPQGALPSGYAQVTANQGTFTTVVDLTSLTVTVTPSAAGRRFRITACALFSSSVADDYAEMNIQEGATVLQLGLVVCRVINQAVSLTVTAIIQPSNAAHTYKLTAQRAVGTGNITMAAGATDPAFILVEDIGV